jgi:hypothetical protein
MNTLNQTLDNLAKQLHKFLLNENYCEYGNLQRSSKSLFQYAFENGILFMNKEIVQDSYEETFYIAQSSSVFPLTLIGLDYQENQFTCK